MSSISQSRGRMMCLGWGRGRGGRGPTAFLSPVFWNESSSPICLSFLSECLLSSGLLQRIPSHVHLSSKQ